MDRHFLNFNDENDQRVAYDEFLNSVIDSKLDITKSETKNVKYRRSKEPSKVLEVPGLLDDFYLHLVDWSSGDQIAVALGNSVYLWNPGSSRINKMLNMSTDTFKANDVVTSVSWSAQGIHLAIGLKSGGVDVWDCAVGKRVRHYPCQQRPNGGVLEYTGHHFLRVGIMDWNGCILSTGSRDHSIYNRDVREAAHFSSSWPSSGSRISAGHRQEVCGLRWSPSDKLLASGGNDNRLLIWEVGYEKPLWDVGDHIAAVKALAWNPHNPSILASGGGTADRCIKFWNIRNGENIDSVDTGSQVCNIAWSTNTNELVSTHGYSLNQVVVWDYPTMKRMATLTGHTYRVLYLASSPDGNSIVTGAGDETLRFWNVFQPLKGIKNSEYSATMSNRLPYKFQRPITIR